MQRLNNIQKVRNFFRGKKGQADVADNPGFVTNLAESLKGTDPEALKSAGNFYTWWAIILFILDSGALFFLQGWNQVYTGFNPAGIDFFQCGTTNLLCWKDYSIRKDHYLRELKVFGTVYAKYPRCKSLITLFSDFQSLGNHFICVNG